MPVNGKLRIDLTGALAGILSVAQKDQRPHPEDEASAEQIKMVAGAATAFICSSLGAKQSAILRKSNIGEDAPG
jgi:hypothetical protein